MRKSQPTMTNQKQNSSRLTTQLPLWAIALLGVSILVFLIGSGVWVFRTVRQVALEMPIVEQPDFDVSPSATAVPNPAVVDAPDAPPPPGGEEPAPVTAVEPQPWTGTERVTVLFLGIDRRCDEEGPVRTDSMMLVTVDPVGKTAGMLSLPRDLWVEIPGFSVERINQAHYFGQAYEYPGGGPGLAQDTVEATLGIDVDYYATVNFAAFVQAVDLIGGITLDVPEAIDDPDYPDECYGYDPFELDAGRQQLDGATALKYARTRTTEGGDVDRAGRQQQVVLAVRDQALGQISELLLQAPQLWRTFQENVRTTMSLEEAVQLAWLIREIPAENIRQAVIDYNYVYVEQTPEGQDVLVPIRENIRALRDELFAPPQPPPATIEDLADRLTAEDAHVAVYNGTTVFGLAGETADYLEANDINVTEVGNADSAAYTTSQIIDFGDHPYTTQYLTQLMNIPPLNVSDGRRPDGDYDVLVIIGSEWQLPDP